MLARRPAPKTVPPPLSLPEALQDTLLLLCASPLATMDELLRFGRVPASTLRDRLRKLTKMGMADSAYNLPAKVDRGVSLEAIYAQTD